MPSPRVQKGGLVPALMPTQLDQVSVLYDNGRGMVALSQGIKNDYLLLHVSNYIIQSDRIPNNDK